MPEPTGKPPKKKPLKSSPRAKPAKAPSKKRFTITEAAKKLGIKRESVFKAIKKGRLKARQVPVKIVQTIWMIDAESVEGYLVSQSHQERGLKNP